MIDFDCIGAMMPLEWHEGMAYHAVENG